MLAAAGCVVLLALVLLNLAQRDSRLVGTNAVPARQPVADVPPGQQLCQRGVTLPAGAAKLVLSISTSGNPGPPLEATVTEGGRTLATGRAPGGWKDGAIGIPMSEVARSHTGADVCFVNRGGVRLSVYGAPTAFESRLTVGRTRFPAEVALLWSGKFESWFAAIPGIADNVTNAGTSLFGPATLWLAFALVLIAGALGVRVLLRETAR
jgi:hypothetical protein